MRYTYESGYENFKKAQRTFIRSRKRHRIFFHLKTWGYALIGLILVATCAPIAFRPGLHPPALVGYILGCGALGGGLVGSALWPLQRRRAYRVWNGDQDVLHIYLEVDGPLLITGTVGRSEARLQRAAVCGVIEDEELILLLLNKKKFLYIPKSIGELAITDIRGWLSLPGAPETC